MISGPSCCSWSVVSDFTDASVPTGMNTGVWMVPCRVTISPRRAAPSVARIRKESLLITNPSAGDLRNLRMKSYRTLLQLHLLDAHAARELEREAALLDRRVDFHVRELVARLVAVTFDVLELRGQVRLFVDENSDVPDALRDRLALRIEIERVVRLVRRIREG